MQEHLKRSGIVVKDYGSFLPEVEEMSRGCESLRGLPAELGCSWAQVLHRPCPCELGDHGSASARRRQGASGGKLCDRPAEVSGRRGGERGGKEGGVEQRRRERKEGRAGGEDGEAEEKS